MRPITSGASYTVVWAISVAQTQGDGEAEHSIEAYRGGAWAGQVDPEGKFGLFKAEGLTVAVLRQAVIHVRQRLNTSERRTCNTIGMARSSQRYKSTNKTDDEELRQAMIRLASFYVLKGGALITSVSSGYGAKKVFNCLTAIRSANGCITRIVPLFV